MTTIRKETVACSVCGSQSERTTIGSTNEFGSPDLDTRPPEMKRSTLFAWIHRCPDCGYCAPDITGACDGSSSIIRSERYLERLNNPEFPELANSFLAHALLTGNSGNFAAAGLATMHAVWVCDDIPEYCNRAAECRKAAARLLQTADEKGQLISQQHGVMTAIRVDLLRRAGEFVEAGNLVATHDTSSCDEIINRILAAQSTLIETEDTAAHTTEEALRDTT